MRKLPALLITGMLALGTSLVGTGSAQAVAWGCGSGAPPDIDHGSYHTAITADNVFLRNGPYTACTAVAGARTSDVLDYYCFTYNSYGNTWTYLRDVTTGYTGWVNDGNLRDGGSIYNCG
jgi:hypothetical protein